MLAGVVDGTIPITSLMGPGAQAVKSSTVENSIELFRLMRPRRFVFQFTAGAGL
jgi:hypothetical protein